LAEVRSDDPTEATGTADSSEGRGTRVPVTTVSPPGETGDGATISGDGGGGGGGGDGIGAGGGGGGAIMTGGGVGPSKFCCCRLTCSAGNIGSGGARRHIDC